jgi:CheY-like chemotaxis protein
MSGHDACRHLRLLDGTKTAMLVALTGWGTEEDRRRTREAGFDHHLTKPAEFDAVELLLEEARVRADRG